MSENVQIVYFTNEQHEEYRLLYQMFHLCLEGVFYCYYKEYFDHFHTANIKNASVKDWSVCTTNSYYDNAVRNWCMMFGNDRLEKTHYCKLLKYKNIKIKLTRILSKSVTEEGLKENFLRSANMTENEYSEFHRKTITYRNKHLIHREYSPQEVNEGDIHYPVLKPIKDTFIFLFGAIIQVLNEYKTENGETGKFELQYVNIFSAPRIEEFYNKSISALEKELLLITKLNPIFKQSP